MGLSQSEAKKAAEDTAAEEESKCLAAEAAGEGGISDEGASAGYVVSRSSSRWDLHFHSYVLNIYLAPHEIGRASCGAK